MCQRNQSVRDSYFDKIDTERKAYWLGMLYADGSNDRRSRIVLGLSGEDRYLLEEFKSDLNFGGKIYQAKQYITHKEIPYRVEIQNKRLSRDLVRHGVVPSKSLILKFPTEEQVRPEFMPHFVRGVFDGDGYVGRVQNRLEASITSSNDFCVGLQKFLSERLGLNTYLKSYGEGGAKSVYMASRAAVVFLDYIYGSEGLKMKRKFDTFFGYMQSYSPRLTECNSSIPTTYYNTIVQRWKKE